MRNLIVFLLLLSVGCSPSLDKALQKVAATDRFTPPQDALLSTKCAAQYPPLNVVTPGTEGLDSTRYLNAIRDLEEQLAETSTDLQNVLNMVEVDKSDLTGIAATLAKRVDSLRNVTNALKSGRLPGIDRNRTDTLNRKNDAEVKRLDTELQRTKEDLAKIRVDLAAALALHEVKNVEISRLQKALDDKPDRYWKGFLHGAGAGAGLLFLIGIFFKLKGFV